MSELANPEWASIEWLPDYEFSDDGQVKSHKKGKVRLLSTTKTDSKGYHMLALFVDGRRVWHRLHKLMCLAHYGPPLDGQEVCHRDGNKDHNHLSNLYYGTRQQNILDMVEHGNHRNARKTHCNKGHEFTEVNTYVDRKGRRTCRECRRRWVNDWKAQKGGG